jgi:DNA-binding MarR family transcriptional regulator
MATELRFDPIAEARRLWGERWGAEVTPSMAAVTSIMRAQQILLARLNAILADFDLTFARYEALMLLQLSSRGSLPLGKIGDRLQVHRTSVTNLIDGLEKSGYVRRLAHESDRRTTLAEITPRGREVATTATELLNEARFGTDSLEPDELETIYELLRGFREHADEIDPA